MELNFRNDTRSRKYRFIAKSFSHPAKLVLPLQIWLIEKYSRPGEILCDPMAGSGTILVGAAMGRNIICVELESKFCDMMKGNWEKIQQQGPELGITMGQAVIIQGDARKLAEIVQGIDSVMFSPPYADQPTASRTDAGILAHEEGCKCNFCRKNRGNRGMSQGYRQVDLAVFSPPYEASVSNGKEGPSAGSDIGAWKEGRAKKFSYTQYGEPCKPDVICTSPPYEGSVSSEKSGIDWSKGTRGIAEGNKPRDKSKEPAFAHSPFGGAEWKYGSSEGNIGNLKGENYLTEMLKIYRGCFAILKPNGWLVLVVKNFIRDHKEIDLAADTVQLCEAVGFHLEETHYRRLTQQSFWRTIALQRCDHRRGSKQDPRCKLGLTCPVKEEQQLSLERKPKTSQEMVEKLCSEYVNSSPEIDREQILAFRKDKNCR